MTAVQCYAGWCQIIDYDGESDCYDGWAFGMFASYHDRLYIRLQTNFHVTDTQPTPRNWVIA